MKLSLKSMIFSISKEIKFVFFFSGSFRVLVNGRVRLY